MWPELRLEHQVEGDGLFPEVFVPPVANDSGSAIGTAIDAQLLLLGTRKSIGTFTLALTSSQLTLSIWRKRSLRDEL